MTDALPGVAVHKFASCDGCQLAFLSLEEELLAIAGRLHIAFFPEARSQAEEGPYDISFVEGSITTEHDAKRIREVRSQSRVVVAIGACALAGGIQALRNWGDVEIFKNAVYTSPEWIHALETATPISEHIHVDFELGGCPVSKAQLVDVVVSLLYGRVPQIPTYSVCIECKRKGNVCVMVAGGQPCAGPVTHAGCNALCPTYRRACFGCYGPSERSKSDALAAHLLAAGVDRDQIVRLLRGFTGYARPFRTTTEGLERRS